jgi:hypothetical protein
MQRAAEAFALLAAGTRNSSMTEPGQWLASTKVTPTPSTTLSRSNGSGRSHWIPTPRMRCTSRAVMALQ